jgi:hypothetical protein
MVLVMMTSVLFIAATEQVAGANPGWRCPLFASDFWFS